MGRFAVILPAAGKSSRFNDRHYKKPFVPLNDKPVWLHAAEPFLKREDVIQTILVIAKEDEEALRQKFAANLAFLDLEIVIGGDERSDSVRNALQRVRSEADFVAIHDAARPCIADTWISAVFAQAEHSQAALLATPIRGTIKRVAGRRIQATVPREGLWEAQTPQVFSRELLLQAYENPPAGVTDDAQVVEAAGVEVAVVECSPMNLKITTQDDLKLAQAMLGALPRPNLTPPRPFENDDHWR